MRPLPVPRAAPAATDAPAGSHKRRDNRCHISAPKLEHGLTRALEQAGWEVHTQLDDPAAHGTAPLEHLAGAADERDATYGALLREAADGQRALIVKVSHIGGHKFAGNCIVRPPPSCVRRANA